MAIWMIFSCTLIAVMIDRIQGGREMILGKMEYRWALVGITGDPPRPRYFLTNGYGPKPQSLLLFRTRSEARNYVKEEFGYIARSRRLRGSSHLRMPVVVKVKVVYQVEV